METRAARISFKIMMVPPVFALLLGFLLVIFPQISIARNYQLFTGQPWADFIASDAKVGEFISMLNMLIGVQIITFAILAIAITVTAYRRGEKWSWYILLFVYTLNVGSGILWEASTNCLVPLVMYAIILIVAYVGLAISAISANRGFAPDS